MRGPVRSSRYRLARPKATVAGWVRGLTACFLSERGNRTRACARTVSDQDRDVAPRRHTVIFAMQAAYKALLSDVNVLRRAAGLRDGLGSFDEEIFETAAEIK